MYLISEVTSLMMLPDSFKKLFWPQFSVNTEAHWPYATKVTSLLGLSAPVHILSYSIKVSNDTIINTNWVPRNLFCGTQFDDMMTEWHGCLLISMHAQRASKMT